MSASTAGRAEILVVGGGIGGLAAALALARRGLRARVLEKAPEFGEIGYGIQLGPNAYRMLDWLGVAKEIEQTAVFPDHLMLIDALTDREVTRLSWGGSASATARRTWWCTGATFTARCWRPAAGTRRSACIPRRS